MKLKSTTIIDTRNKLSKDTTHYWTIIRRENKIDKGFTRNYDLDALINSINQMAEKRIKVKLAIQAINMCYKKLEFEKFKDETNYFAIYKLSELNEQYTQWDIIQKHSTINPVLKAKKGKKALSTTEHFTFAKIRAIKKKLQLEIDALHKQIEDFNAAAEIETDTEFSFMFAA